MRVSGGSARGMSPSSGGGGGASAGLRAEGPRRMGGILGRGIVIVATASVRRKIAPPRPATQAAESPR